MPATTLRHRPVLLTLFLLASAVAVSAQPWPLIRLRQAPGSSPQTFENPKSAPDAGVQVFGFSSLTGKPETWQFETHLSFAGIEEFDLAANGMRREDPSHTMVLVYRAAWSHRPDEALQALRKARYLQVSIFQVGLGSENDFASLLASRKARMDAINLDRPDLAYQALYGAPAGTVILLSPLASLKSLDEGVSRNSAAYLRSTGSPSTRGGTNVAPTSELLQDNVLFRIDPRLSAVSDSTAEADPAFWRQK